MADAEGARRTMRTLGLWTFRTLLVCLGLLLAAGAVASAFDSASDLGVLSRVGGVIMGAGWLGILVSVAFGFPQMWRQIGQSRPPLKFRGAWRVRRQRYRRARRQIDGAEPYRDDEIPYLRWLAERLLAERNWSPTTWSTWISLMALWTGLVLRPFQMPADFGQHMWGTAFVPVWPILADVTRLLAAVLVLVFASTAVAVWRTRNDDKVKAFLEHTRPVAWPTD